MFPYLGTGRPAKAARSIARGPLDQRPAERWRNQDALPEELIFNVNYLGGNMPTFTLNFSRPGSQVIAQYLMFMSLGREGYTRVMQYAQDVAMRISSGVAEMGPYRLLSDGGGPRPAVVRVLWFRDRASGWLWKALASWVVQGVTS